MLNKNIYKIILILGLVLSYLFYINTIKTDKYFFSGKVLLNSKLCNEFSGIMELDKNIKFNYLDIVKDIKLNMKESNKDSDMNDCFDNGQISLINFNKI